MYVEDKLKKWNMQLDQSSDYGLFFDKKTVKEMVETIETQQEVIKILQKDKSIDNNFKDVYKKLEEFQKQINGMNKKVELLWNMPD